MQARTAARELALILFSQLNERFKRCNNENFEKEILKSVRILGDNAQEELKISLTRLIEMKESIQRYQSMNEKNLEKPIGAPDEPVRLPMTDDMLKSIDEVIEVSDKAFLALSAAELATLEEKEEVKSYVVRIANEYKKNKKEIDEQIQKCSSGWDISRIFTMDKDILRIAIVELLYIEETPMKVAVDQAVELAKKYSSEDSASFINGILAKVILENGVK